MVERIEVDADKMAGKPVIEGTRIPVGKIVHLLAHGLTFEEVKKDYPSLEDADIRAALEYAAETVEEQSVFGLEGGDFEVRS